MPSQILQQKIYPWDGGQDSTRNPVLISPNDVVDSDNIVYTTYSTKRQRPGLSDAFIKRPAGSNRIMAGIDFWRLGSQRVVYYDGVSIYSLDPATGNVDDISGGITIPIDEVVTFLAFQGLLIIFFSGGTLQPKYWTQTGDIQNLSFDAPLAPFGQVWLNKLWVPDPSVPGRILHTNTGTADDFAGGDSGAIDLDPNDNDPDGITAVFPPLYGALYVAKRFSLYKISPVFLSDGTLVFSSEKISNGVGCISHTGVVATENTVFFPSSRGFHMLEPTDKFSSVESTFLSAVIQPPWLNNTNFSRAQYMQGVYDYDLNSVLWTFPTLGNRFPNDVWGLSLAANKWYRWRDFNHTSLFTYVNSQTKKRGTVCGGRSGDFGLLDLAVNRDYGEHIPVSITSGIICPTGSPDNQFSFNYITPIFVPQFSGKFTIILKVDGRVVDRLEYSMADDSLGSELGEKFTLAESYLGGIPQVKLVKKMTKGYGAFYQLLVIHEPTNPDIDQEVSSGFEILGIIVDVSPVSKGTGERAG